jgi:hypothetical protein
MADLKDKSKSELIETVQRAKSRMAKFRENAEASINTVTTTAVAGGTAFGLEYMRGRYGRLNPENDEVQLTAAGLPVSLLFGVGGHALGFFGVGGSFGTKLLHDVAHGGVAAYGSEMGFKLGNRAFQETGEARETTNAQGALPASRQRYMGPGTPIGMPSRQRARSPMYAR